jgi:hypothetical protein
MEAINFAMKAENAIIIRSEDQVSLFQEMGARLFQRLESENISISKPKIVTEWHRESEKTYVVQIEWRLFVKEGLMTEHIGTLVYGPKKYWLSMEKFWFNPDGFDTRSLNLSESVLLTPFTEEHFKMIVNQSFWTQQEIMLNDMMR